MHQALGELEQPKDYHQQALEITKEIYTKYTCADADSSPTITKGSSCSTFLPHFDTVNGRCGGVIMDRDVRYFVIISIC